METTPTTRECDLLITAVETNGHHGVGILLQRFFGTADEFVCIRSTSLYGGDEPFGAAHFELNSEYLTADETERRLRALLAGYRVRRILCVPYYRAEFVHALLARKITGAPLCTYLMDDRNVFADGVSDALVAELLAASDLRLGISPEMCAAYAAKYGFEIHLLPPLLSQATRPVPCYWSEEPGETVRAAMIGNVWTAQRFEQLRRAARESGLHLDWYGNGPAAKWLKGAPEEWEADNIRCMGYLPEEDLVAALASYPFIVVPSGSMDPDDDNLAFSYLSLPSRLLFLHASTDTPVLVLGSRNSAAGRFTLRLGTGLCSGYSAAELRATRQELLRPEVRAQLSANIRRWAPTFVMPNAGEWIWQSLAAGRPQPAGFHAAFAESAPVEFAGLTRLGRVPAQPAPEHPKAGEAYRDTFASSFRFARAHHLEVIRHHDSGLPAAEALDLTRYQGAAAHYIVAGSVKPGGDVLFIGADAPPGIQTLASTHRVWRLRDHAKWRVDGFAGDPAYVESLSGTEAYPPQFPQFDAIVSTGWCGEIPDDPHVLEGLSLYLQACTRPGGINAHFFSAVLHGTYFWTGAGHAYLQRRFAPAPGWRTLDELLWQRDLFFMSEAVYHEHWERATGRSYGEFGRPLSLGLIWRQR